MLVKKGEEENGWKPFQSTIVNASLKNNNNILTVHPALKSNQLFAWHCLRRQNHAYQAYEVIMVIARQMHPFLEWWWLLEYLPPVVVLLLVDFDCWG